MFSNKLFGCGADDVGFELTIETACFFNELLFTSCCWGCDNEESVLCFCVGTREVVEAAANFISLDGGFNFDLYLSVESLSK